MANFDEQSVYNKHQNNCNGDCGDNCSCNDDCGCCPPGLVSVTDCNGKHVACLTPNDAACYRVNSHIPPTGYVKVYFPLTGDDRVYYGDMTPQQAIDFIDKIVMMQLQLLSLALSLQECHSCLEQLHCLFLLEIAH